MSYELRWLLLSVTILIVILTPPIVAQDASPTATGFITIGASGSEGNSTTLTVTNVRARVSGDIDNKTTYTFFVDAVRDDILLDAAICRKITTVMMVTAGQFKSPYGTDNLLPAWRYPFINRGYLKSEVSPLFCDIGVQVSAKSASLEITAALMNGAGANKTEADTHKSIVLRTVVTPVPGFNLSGNYSHGTDLSEGGIEFYDGGFDGAVGTVVYAGEISVRRSGGSTTHAGATWVSCDCATCLACIPVITPALKYERYDPDTCIADNCICCFTTGLSLQFAAAMHTNRLMINYEHRDFDAGVAGKRVSAEYLIRF